MKFLTTTSALSIFTLTCLLNGCSSADPNLQDSALVGVGGTTEDLDGDGQPDLPEPGGDGDVSSSGGSLGTGGDDEGSGGGNNPALACVDDYLIDDFSEASTYELYRPYSDGSQGGSMTPAPGSSFAAEPSTDGDGKALHLTGSGFGNWGAGIGRTFSAPIDCKGRSVGLRFRAKGNGPITVAAPVSAVVPASEGGSCTAAEACNNSHETSVQLTSGWTTYEVLWSELNQVEGWGLPVTFDPKSVVEILFAARPEAMPFDFWVDDLELIDNGETVDPPSGGSGGSSGGDGDGSSSGGAPSVGSCVLDTLLGETGFNTWFQSRRDPFYTYANLCEALKGFPGFAHTGNTELDKREIAAFFANVSRETGELDYIEQFPESRGSTGNYYGRGPLQLTWDYNYRAAGEFLGVDLISNPSLLHTDGVMTWRASLWFWMHSDGAAKGTCHGAIVDGRGFGQTINVINGGLECPSAGNAAALQRVAYYEDYCARLGVSPGTGLHC